MDLSELKGVGPKTTTKLNSLGIYSVEDVLFHLPFRYQDRTRIIPIADLRPGDQAVIDGKILSSHVKFARTRQLEVLVEDASGCIKLKFFHFTQAQQKNLAIGKKIRCYGEVKLFQRQLIMAHPEYRFTYEQVVDVEENLTPVYPSTEGLQQANWRSLSEQALRLIKLDTAFAELLPSPVLADYQLTNIKQALAFVHRPPPDVNQDLLEQGLHPMQQRLAFEELLAHQVSLRQLRVETQQHQSYACPMAGVNKVKQQFITNLGFSLTGAQQSAEQEIADDLQKPVPMMRLVQGDVGSGKTVVAAMAALQVIASAYQVVIMAPTELLAEQHYQQFKTWFEPLGIKVAWLSGKLKTAERREMLAAISSGEASMVVGTHALFQKSVAFNQLALIVIDEQHRFGVAQRQALRMKGAAADHYPHQLIMTATPIPRTLAMTVYADLDTSIINELPPGRTPVNTIVVNKQRRDEVIEKVQQLCERGGQVYWVCPLIEESDVLECEAAEKITEQLQKKLKNLNVSLVHGKMKPEQKQQLMQDFKAKKIDILVATTVIEVGINVPNATLMVIENSERMGLAQLHQLRGRVGRGAKESHCVLLYQDPLSENARKRLTVMRESTDGFYIAEQDLSLRGPGEMLGTRQTGLQRLRIANVIRDRQLLPKVQRLAKQIIKNHPECIDALKRRWIGENEVYSKV
jgi:ATP-dependent DNA helicase RecG